MLFLPRCCTRRKHPHVSHQPLTALCLLAGPPTASPHSRSPCLASSVLHRLVTKTPSFSTVIKSIPRRLASLLSLARPRGPAIRRNSTGLLATSEALRTTAQSPRHLAHSRHLLIFHLDQRTGSATAALLNRLLVRRDIEANEQHQVRRQDPHASKSRKLLTSACTSSRQPREVRSREVGVGSEVDESEIDDEL